MKILKKSKLSGFDGKSLVEGQTSEEECRLLFDLAKSVKRGCIIEIGSFRGRSTIALAQGVFAGNLNVPLYAVDPHEGFTGALGGKFGPQDRKAFLKNILDAEVAEVVRLVNLSSEIIAQNWQQKVGLLWIDGDHTYEGVKRDFSCWEPHLLSDAIIAFHDSIDPQLGPFHFLNELLSLGQYKKIISLGQTTVIQKIGVWL